MMSIFDCRTKKDLKAKVGQAPRFNETSFFGPEFKGDGSYTIVGPSLTEQKWYAIAVIEGGLIKKVS